MKFKRGFIDLNVFWNFFKLFLTNYVIFLIPIYWYNYGLQNFLWLSDIGLFLTLVGLWTNSNLLISISAVSVLLVELIWNLDFFLHLVFNIKVIKLSDYMFNKKYSIPLRLLSLFHIFMPIIWIIYLMQNGYNQEAIYYSIFLYWVILLLTYLFTDPIENINWVFLPQINKKIGFISPISWILLLFILFPLLIFFPTHYLFIKLFMIN